MLAWYCGEPGHEVALPCLAHQLRALPKGPERDALQLKMHEAAEHEASKHASKVNPNPNPNPNSNPNPNPNPSPNLNPNPNPIQAWWRRGQGWRG